MLKLESVIKNNMKVALCCIGRLENRYIKEYVDGNYNERIDDNNTLYSDKQATFTGDIIYYTE